MRLFKRGSQSITLRQDPIHGRFHWEEEGGTIVASKFSTRRLALSWARSEGYSPAGSRLPDTETDARSDRQMLDHFAGLAMQALLTDAAHHCDSKNNLKTACANVAEMAYHAANAMMKEREKC